MRCSDQSAFYWIDSKTYTASNGTTQNKMLAVVILTTNDMCFHISAMRQRRSRNCIETWRSLYLCRTNF
jgi:hypothetical protein